MEYPYILGAVVAGIGALVIIRKLRSEKKRQVGRDYPADTVILHQIRRGPFAPSMSPFCLKLETYFRMKNLPYQNEFSYKTGPKGKVPWIEYNGNIYSDSSFIMKHFNDEKGLDRNQGYSPEQNAIAHALQKMAEEHMYWLVILCRWEFYRAETSRTLTQLPSPVVWVIARRTRKMAHAQGVGRHSQSEVEQLLEEDLSALSDVLGEKQYMMGDEPTELDCAIFGQVSQVKWHVPKSCRARIFLEESLTNLNSYCERMKTKFWPDWDDCISHGFTTTPTK